MRHDDIEGAAEMLDSIRRRGQNRSARTMTGADLTAFATELVACNVCEDDE